MLKKIKLLIVLLILFKIQFFWILNQNGMSRVIRIIPIVYMTIITKKFQRRKYKKFVDLIPKLENLNFGSIWNFSFKKSKLKRE